MIRTDVKNAQDTKSGSFLLAAHQYLVDNYPNMTKPQKQALKSETFKGWELVQSTARLCAMNMLLHGIGNVEAASRRFLDENKRQDSASTDRFISGGTPLLQVANSLAADPGDRFNLILVNPPSAANCCTNAMSTPCYGCPPACSTPRG